MAISKKRLKLCLYGNVYGAYRSQNLIKILLDDGYRVAWVLPEFYQERGLKKTLATKIAHKIFGLYATVDLFIKALLSDVLYVLPVNVQLIKTALWISKLCQTKLVVEMHISLYDSLAQDQQTVAADSKAAKELMTLDSLALTKPDYLIYLAQYEMDHWAKLLNVAVDHPKKFIAPLFTEPTTACKQDYQYQTPLRICWWGTLIALHGVETMIEAMALLKAKSFAFTFHMFAIPPAGQGYLLDKYKTLIEDKELSDHVFIRPDLRFADESLPNYLVDNCDLALGIFGKSGRALSGIPTKLIDSLTLGLPTLTMSAPALNEFFDVANDLWTCDPDAEALAQRIIEIGKSAAQPVDWHQTRNKVLNTFSLRRYKKVVGEVLNQISSQL